MLYSTCRGIYAALPHNLLHEHCRQIPSVDAFHGPHYVKFVLYVLMCKAGDPALMVLHRLLKLQVLWPGRAKWHRATTASRYMMELVHTSLQWNCHSEEGEATNKRLAGCIDAPCLMLFALRWHRMKVHTYC